MSKTNSLPSLPLEWDLDAVRDFYRERGLDFDKLGPRFFGRKTNFAQETAEAETFYREYAEFLAKRAKS